MTSLNPASPAKAGAPGRRRTVLIQNHLNGFEP
jgi:hypothetical protein